MESATYTEPMDRVRAAVEDLPDGSLYVACSNRDQAVDVEQTLYDAREGTEFHVETRPVANDDTGSVDHYAVLIRQLTFSREVGWVSSDVPAEPAVDLRDE